MIARLHTAPSATWALAPRRPRHAREWALALALALAGHVLLLESLGAPDLGEGAPAPSPASGGPVFVVRTLEPASREAPAETGGVPAAVPAAVTQPAPPAGGSVQAPAGSAAEPRPQAEAATTQAAAQVYEAAEAALDASGPSAAEVYAGAPPPVWPARLPGDFVAQYRLQRGDEPARDVTLRFEAGEGRYALQLLSVGSRGPEQSSLGRLEATGLAPERYLDRRRARAAAAANFDPARSRITYSGAPREQPLFAGAQDRLSWIVQLSAIVEADPARWQERARLSLYVTGARGDAQLWVFTVHGRVPLDGRAGAGEGLLHLVREPERPYDLRVEAWLDPARQHLPARLQLSPVPAGRPLNWTRIP